MGVIWGLYRYIRRENGNYYLGFRAKGVRFVKMSREYRGSFRRYAADRLRETQREMDIEEDLTSFFEELDADRDLVAT